MSEELVQQESWEALQELLQSGDAAGLNEFLGSLSSAEIARALSRLEDEEQSTLVLLLGPEAAADLLEELVDAQGADIIEELEPKVAAAIIDEMESDHRVDVLGEMDTDDVEAILDNMDPEEAEDARQLLTYPEDTAGGIMITEYVCYPINWTVGGVLEDMREHADTYSDYGVQYAYVLSETGVLVGVIRLRDLVLSRRNTPLANMMIPNPLYVRVDTPLDEVDDFFDRYAFVGVPVVDEDGLLVGVVRRADAEEAYGERAEQSLMRFGGIISGEELRSMSVGARANRRLVWLAVNLGMSLLAPAILLRFEGTLEQAQSAVALFFFLPVIANISGCTGNQAVAVSIRELAVGLIQPRDFFRVVLKEMQVGLILGPAMGLAAALVALAVNGNPYLGVIVGAALGLNVVVALVLGGCIPLGIRRLGLDPALAAPLFVTTLVDACGFFLVLTLAYYCVSTGRI